MALTYKEVSITVCSPGDRLRCGDREFIVLKRSRICKDIYDILASDSSGNKKSLSSNTWEWLGFTAWRKAEPIADAASEMVDFLFPNEWGGYARFELSGPDGRELLDIACKLRQALQDRDGKDL